MSVLTLLIDRTGGKNIYNLFKNGRLYLSVKKNVPTRIITGFYELCTSFYDTIYLSSKKSLYLEIEEFKNRSEYFFNLFFPEELSKVICYEEGDLIVFTDEKLFNIRLDFFYSRNSFLGERYRIFYDFRDKNNTLDNNISNLPIRFLIIIGNTNNIPFAKNEAFGLFRSISDNFSSKLVDIELFNTSQLTRQADFDRLFQKIRKSHIIHYTGHFDSNRKQIGWKIGKRIITASELSAHICNSNLIFSSSCYISSYKNDFAYSLGSITNKRNIITAYSHTADRSENTTFVRSFYKRIFKGSTIGAAFYSARWEIFPDFLLSPPFPFRISGPPDLSLISIQKNINYALDTKNISKNFPYQIARFFSNKLPSPINYKRIFYFFISLSSSLIYGEYLLFGLKPFEKNKKNNIEDYWYYTMKAGKILTSLRLRLTFEPLVKVIFFSKSNIYRIFNIIKIMESKKMNVDNELSLESSKVSIQHLVEGLLIDANILSAINIYYIENGAEERILLYKGDLPVKINHKHTREIMNRLKQFRENSLFRNLTRKRKYFVAEYKDTFIPLLFVRR